MPFSSIFSLAPKNEPEKKGELATKKFLFGECSRYAAFAIHTRFESCEFFIRDAEQKDSLNLPAIIFQGTLKECLERIKHLSCED